MFYKELSKIAHSCQNRKDSLHSRRVRVRRPKEFVVIIFSKNEASSNAYSISVKCTSTVIIELIIINRDSSIEITFGTEEWVFPRFSAFPYNSHESHFHLMYTIERVRMKVAIRRSIYKSAPWKMVSQKRNINFDSFYAKLFSMVHS